MEEILQAYGLPKEIVTIIMMLYKNKKFANLMVTQNYFEIVTGVLQADTILQAVPYSFIIYQDYKRQQI